MYKIKDKVKGNIETQRKLQAYQTFKIDNFSQKCFLKNKTETNKQEQNISLNLKNIGHSWNLMDTLHGKGFKAKQ